MRDFRHIRAWQRAHALAIAIHRLARDFDRNGKAKLRAQLTSAAHSIATNIVEGCGAVTHKEFARFLDISIKSSNETEYHLLTSHDLELISDADWEKYTRETIGGAKDDLCLSSCHPTRRRWTRTHWRR